MKTNEKTKSTKSRDDLRMQIVKDALATIRKPNIEVRQGYTYVGIAPVEDYDDQVNEENEKRFKAYADQSAPFHTDTLKDSKTTKCGVCALGAMFLGHVDRRNGVSVRDVVHETYRIHILDRLKDAFNNKELDAIESVFERDCDADEAAPKMMKVAGDLYDRNRLEAMLRHLIKNGVVID